MSSIDELFKKTNVLAKKFRRNGRVRISQVPQRNTEKVRKENQLLHRYGPEDRPPALPKVSPRVCEQISTAPERKPMAFCPTCNCDVPMKWKARKKRGKSVNDWFVCAKCNCDRLEIKILEKENK